jgi:chromosome segregation ATPase
LEQSVADHATGFQTLKDSVSRLQKDNDAVTSELDHYKSHAADLEGESERLQVIISELESRKQDLQQDLVDRDNKVAELRNTVLEHEHAAVDFEETLARKEASLNALSTEAETLLRSKDEIIARVHGMEEELVAARSENSRLTEELAGSRRAAEALQERMAELVHTTEERQGELVQALSVAQSEAGHGAVLAQELLVMTESTTELEKQLFEARNTITALGNELRDALERNSQLELTLVGSRKEVEEMKGKITSAKRREAELVSKLLATDATRQSLEEATTGLKNELRTEQVKAQTTILGLLQKIDGLQTLRDNEGQSFSNRVAALEGEIEGLLLTVQNANEAQQTALAAFNSCKDELGNARSALTTEQATCDDLRMTLAEVEEQVSILRSAKAVDVSSMATLRAVYEKWKKMQTDCISELESTVCHLVPVHA